MLKLNAEIQNHRARAHRRLERVREHRSGSRPDPLEQSVEAGVALAPIEKLPFNARIRVNRRTLRLALNRDQQLPRETEHVRRYFAYQHAAIRSLMHVLHLVTVRANDFEFEGRPYKSLSAVARHITRTRWNGWTFFGLRVRLGS